MINLEKERDRIIKYAEGPIDFIYQRSFDELNRYVNLGLDISNVISFQVKLKNVFLHEAKKLLYELDRGNETQIVKAVAYALDIQFFSMKLSVETYLLDGLTHLIKPIRTFYLFQLSMGRVENADWLGERLYYSDTPEDYQNRHDNNTDEFYKCSGRTLERSLKSTKALFNIISTEPSMEFTEVQALRIDDEFPVWRESYLEALALRLYMIMSSKLEPTVTPESMPSCGIYEELFTHWDDAKELEKTISKVCDYHMKIVDKPIQDFPDFDISPFRVLPVEVLAFVQVRKQLGYETSLPKHELLDSPFVTNLPDKVADIRDPQIEIWLDATRKFLKDFKL